VCPLRNIFPPNNRKKSDHDPRYKKLNSLFAEPSIKQWFRLGRSGTRPFTRAVAVRLLYGGHGYCGTVELADSKVSNEALPQFTGEDRILATCGYVALSVGLGILGFCPTHGSRMLSCRFDHKRHFVLETLCFEAGERKEKRKQEKREEERNVLSSLGVENSAPQYADWGKHAAILNSALANRLNLRV